MNLQLLEPDLHSIVHRIKTGAINLSPNFQRGEVWDVSYQKRLIDSILRGWNIPPIHVVCNPETEVWEVLDGQQRLRAIAKFAQSKIAINGNIEPRNSFIQELHGLYFHELPPSIIRKFENFSIRFVIISEYTPAETSELFFRLNQPVSLSAAEHRNAYFGSARDSVKKLVQRMEDYGLTREKLGFSNSRLAYDDLIARLCLTVEMGDLSRNITASSITDRYKQERSFGKSTLKIADETLRQMGIALQSYIPPKLSKGALISWFFVIARMVIHGFDFSRIPLAVLIYEVENIRKSKNEQHSLLLSAVVNVNLLLSVYNTKLSSQIAHPKSILVRDIILWLLIVDVCDVSDRGLPQSNSNQLKAIKQKLNDTSIRAIYSSRQLELFLTDFVSFNEWGVF